MQFTTVGCADVNDRFRAFVSTVYGGPGGTGNIQHMHSSMEAQVDGASCMMHPHGTCQLTLETDPDIGITGTPCPPYSTQRAKRTVEGSVKNHALFYVTDEILPRWIGMTEPKFVVVEQVMGFGQRVDNKDTSTPLARRRLAD